MLSTIQSKCAYVIVLLWLLACVGCGESIDLPPAKSLNVSTEQLSQLYGFDEGQESIKVSEGISLQHPDQRLLSLRVIYPQNIVAKQPLIIFSHGNWSDYTKYDLVVKHWVSHGYVVVLPYHLDAGGMLRGIANSVRYGQLGLVQSRIDDVTLLLDRWADIEAQIPDLVGRVDLTKVAATGHSFGGFTAQQLGGAQAYDPKRQQFVPVKDARIRAVVAISPPGEMFDTITADSWTALDVPTLITTGTWDVNKQFWPEWQAHLLSYQTAKPGDKFSLVIDGADHYLGNLICRPERDQPPQYDALRMINATSVAFLDAYLKGRPEAKAFLQDNGLADLTDGFAVLNQR